VQHVVGRFVDDPLSRQAGKIIDVDKAEIHYNSEWLEKLTYREIGEQADQFSVAEFIARDNIRRRLDAGTRVSLREMLYPLMQGYDSVAVKADVELGGTDQRFNLLAGRTLQEYFKQPPQDILMSPLLEGTDGRKMSSSWGNTITLDAEPNDLFGKIMTVHDDLIIKYFELTTRISMNEIESYKKELANGANPKDYKMKLGYELVKFYHSESAANGAMEYFKNVFEKKEKPTDIPEFKPSAYDIVTVLVESKIAKSKSDARKLIEQGGVKVNGEKVSSIEETVKPGDIVQKGSRFFVKVI
jgi:tyrosyl-tRNA synthetase